MDIKIPHSVLTDYLQTGAGPETIADKLSLSGPTIDHLSQINGDWVYDIEIITNRIDSGSAFGVAREANAILPQFDIPAELKNNPYENSLEDLGELPENPPVTVEVQNLELIKRFACIALSNVNVTPSSEKVQEQLELSGQRPLNNVIDITNELTLRFGQPVHVFDLDKIKGKTMILRESREGEELTTLDDQVHTLQGGDIVIEDGEGRLIDLCGIMGAQNSEVSEDTVNILLFVQTYEPRRIRNTSLYTQERTLASQIFEKQPDPELVLPVLIEGVKLLKERAGAEISSGLIDIYPNPPEKKQVSFDLDWLNRFAGVEFELEQVTGILSALGFKTDVNDSTITATVPSWRVHDIDIKQDLAEEVVRVYGYYRLPSVLPASSVPQTETEDLLKWESETQTYLAYTGFTEVYNYALVSEELFHKAGLSLEHSFALANPLSQDHAYMRPSLIPSMLLTLQANRGKVELPIRIFELANVYLPESASKLAYERSTLCLATQGLSFYEAKGHLDALLRHLHLSLEYIPVSEPPAPFAANQTALLKFGEEELGHIGLISPKVQANFQLEDTVVIAELNFQSLSRYASPIHRFTPVPEHPAIIEDMTFKLPERTTVGPVMEAIKKQSDMIESIELKDKYENNYTFTIHYRHPEKPLSDTDILPLRRTVAESLQENFSATLIGTLA